MTSVTLREYLATPSGILKGYFLFITVMDKILDFELLEELKPYIAKVMILFLTLAAI